MHSDLLAQRESEVQASVIRFYEAFGCRVARFSEGRRSRITRGWPDLYVFLPSKRITWAHETKAHGGKQSADQGTIQTWFEECAVAYVIGGVQAAHDYLASLGLVEL